MNPLASRVTGTGSYLPPRRLSNDDMVRLLAERGLETSDDWIVERTGIRARHFADPGVNASDLALHACRAALEAAGRTPAQVVLRWGIQRGTAVIPKTSRIERLAEKRARTCVS